MKRFTSFLGLNITVTYISHEYIAKNPSSPSDTANFYLKNK